jgi:hypothetical protein
MTQENTPYDAVIADLEEKRDQLTATIEMLKALKGTASMVLPISASNQRQQAEREIKRDSFFGMTLTDAAKKYLSMMKTTKSNPELCEALLSGGFKTSSANFTEVVRSTLQRNKDFVKVSGEWGLSEWYPGRGSGRKARRTSPDEAVVDVTDEIESDEESSAN